MPAYRNRNTGQVVTSAEPRPRLERLACWERLGSEESAPDEWGAGVLNQARMRPNPERAARLLNLHKP